ncbi:hypothetical protein GCK32_018718 [Trichostrongylus colubriformis]|uniref:Uncharacterized protein n=1 Tax=Trichostrongylus colubriformis TaxID=6319 RepID=A0AAN8J1F9_TRICO
MKLGRGGKHCSSGTNLRVLAALVCPPAALALAYKAPHVPSEDSEHHSDESTVYDTISTCKTDRTEGNGTGSTMTLHLHRLFKTASTRRKNVLHGDELEELVENGASKKVTIMSSKRSSGLYAPIDGVALSFGKDAGLLLGSDHEVLVVVYRICYIPYVILLCAPY